MIQGSCRTRKQAGRCTREDTLRKNYTRELKKKRKETNQEATNDTGELCYEHEVIDRVERESGGQQHDTEGHAWNPQLGMSWLEAEHARM